MRVAGQQLKSVDAAPLLLGLLRQVYDGRDGAQILLILTELFNNALDHGVLELDSRLKHGPGGMERFLALRRRRLAALREASIEVVIETRVRRGLPMLGIRIKDSGAGFDHARYPTTGPGTSEAPHGRGITLVRRLCAALEFRGCGNDVRALYPVVG